MLKETRNTETLVMDSADIGATLRTAREAKGLSLGTLSQHTRVQPRVLTAIERNDLSTLPPRPFGRGFVRAYAEEVGLDPERTVRDYFAQFPSAPDSSSVPAVALREPQASFDISSSHWSGLATAVMILLLVVAAAVVLGRRGDHTNEGPAVGTTGSTPPVEARAPEPAPTVPQVTDAAPTAPTAPLTFELTVTRPCWVDASSDGKRAIYRLLQAGDRETLTAEREIVVRVGDAGAVSWRLNGREGGALGADGAIRDLTITPANAASLK
jgi:cytoskeleton protein RodZ